MLEFIRLLKNQPATKAVLEHLNPRAERYMDGAGLFMSHISWKHPQHPPPSPSTSHQTTSPNIPHRFNFPAEPNAVILSERQKWRDYHFMLELWTLVLAGGLGYAMYGAAMHTPLIHSFERWSNTPLSNSRYSPQNLTHFSFRG